MHEVKWVMNHDRVAAEKILKKILIIELTSKKKEKKRKRRQKQKQKQKDTMPGKGRYNQLSFGYAFWSTHAILFGGGGEVIGIF